VLILLLLLLLLAASRGTLLLQALPFLPPDFMQLLVQRDLL